MIEDLMARVESQHFQVISHLQSITSTVQRHDDHYNERPNIPRLSTNNESSRFQNPMSTISFVAQRRRLTCLDNCKCCCHSQGKQNFTWRLPSTFHRIIGMLFIGYTGYPISRPSCDSRICLDRGKIRLEVRYIFPLWFLRFALHAIFHRTLTGGPTIGLVLRRRDEFVTGGILHASFMNDLENIKHCLAVDPGCVNNVFFRDGRTPLHLAVQFNQIEAIRLLLNAGADPDVENDSGFSSRIVAVRIVLY